MSDEIRKLHRPETIPMLGVDCWRENCEHEELEECFAAGTPLNVCRHCWGIWDNDRDRDDEETPESTFWPCKTIQCLDVSGAAEEGE
jgi:hypothetical protein